MPRKSVHVAVGRGAERGRKRNIAVCVDPKIADALAETADKHDVYLSDILRNILDAWYETEYEYEMCK